MVKKVLKYGAGGLFLIFIAIQFIPVERENPPELGPIKARAEIAGVLERSCFDCHSNKTVWPWYSHVAPVSWLVSHDVVDGRGEMNFSDWETYSLKRKIHKLEEVIEKVEAGDMPLPKYLYLHSDAKLSEEQIEMLAGWADSLMIVFEEAAEEEAEQK